jgi:hypothetical protein
MHLVDQRRTSNPPKRLLFILWLTGELVFHSMRLTVDSRWLWPSRF